MDKRILKLFADISKKAQNLPEGITYEKRNELTAESFYRYCQMNPQLRFWQALRNWSGYSFILRSQHPIPSNPNEIVPEEFIDGLQDTFNIEGKDGKVAQ